MSGVHHKHRMKFETDRPRLNVPDAGEQQRRDQFAIGQTPMKTIRYLLQQPFAWRIFQELNKQLDFWMKTDEGPVELGFLSRHSGKPRKEREIAHSQNPAGSRRGFQEVPACR